MSYCTADDCHQPTSLYLCTGHIVELDGLFKDVPVLIPLLDGARAGTAVVRKPGSGGGGGTTGSKPPGNLDAMMLQTWLNQLPDRAHTEAMDNPHAGRTLYMARIWVPNARRLVWGAEEEVVDHAANRERVKDIAPAMPTRQLIPWLREKAGIVINGQQIRDWARRGKLTPAEREPSPTYHPHEVLDVWTQIRKEEAR